jgi:hypothetical protein
MILIAQDNNKYVNEEGDFDPPGGEQVDRLLNAAINRGLDIAVEEVIDRVMGQSIRGAMREAVKNAGPAIDEEIRTMYMTEDLREQVMAARARMEDPYDLGTAYADIVESVKDVLVSRLSASM